MAIKPAPPRPVPRLYLATPVVDDPASLIASLPGLLAAADVAAVPGIAFLSGGQSDEDATAHLDAMNRIGGLPWPLTFSYGRALQAAPQQAWSGRPENVAAGQRAFTHRAMMNSLASRGEWKADLEKKAA